MFLSCSVRFFDLGLGSKVFVSFTVCVHRCVRDVRVRRRPHPPLRRRPLPRLLPPLRCESSPIVQWLYTLQLPHIQTQFRICLSKSSELTTFVSRPFVGLQRLFDRYSRREGTMLSPLTARLLSYSAPYNRAYSVFFGKESYERLKSTLYCNTQLS